MSNKKFLKLLKKMGADDLAIKRISETSLGLADWWSITTGPNMAWILAYFVDQRRLALILADAVEPVLTRLPKAKSRGVELDTLRRWGRGEATDDQLKTARNAAGYAAWASKIYDYPISIDYTACAYAYEAICGFRDEENKGDCGYAAFDAVICGVDVPAIIRRHVSAEEIVILARAYLAAQGEAGK